MTSFTKNIFLIKRKGTKNTCLTIRDKHNVNNFKLAMFLSSKGLCIYMSSTYMSSVLV